MQAAVRKLIVPVVSEVVFEEYVAVLQRVKRTEGFGTDLQFWLETLSALALWVTPVPFTGRVCRDPKDDKFIEAALAANAPTVIARDTDLTVPGEALRHFHPDTACVVEHVEPRGEKTTALKGP